MSSRIFSLFEQLDQAPFTDGTWFADGTTWDEFANVGSVVVEPIDDE